VQGTEAAAEIARAIRAANARMEVDVLIVARGGGSIEDLWSFNEEAVASAIIESVLPVVSGVGHETDFTICDFVADVRAPTPTAAATLVTPDRHALGEQLRRLFRGLDRAMLHRLQAREQRLDHAMRRLVHPATRVAQQGARIDELASRMTRCLTAAADRRSAALEGLARRFLRELRSPLPAGQRVAALAQNLAHLNPESVLDRGYAIVAAADGSIVSDAAQVSAGDKVALTFARGGADATIDSKRS
jgi:exodeoxyribonuclease VII large subunit